MLAKWRNYPWFPRRRELKFITSRRYRLFLELLRYGVFGTFLPIETAANKQLITLFPTVSLQIHTLNNLVQTIQKHGLGRSAGHWLESDTVKQSNIFADEAFHFRKFVQPSSATALNTSRIDVFFYWCIS